MKITYGLYVTHLVAVLLPIIGFWMLLAVIEQQDREQRFYEYLEVEDALDEYRAVFEQEEWYESVTDAEDVQGELPDDLAVTIVRPSGFVLLETEESGRDFISSLDEEWYLLQRFSDSYRWRAPAFSDENEWLGVYELRLSREAWSVAGSPERTAVYVGFFGSVLLLYAGIGLWLQRRLRSPLRSLMNEMDVFAGRPSQKSTPKDTDEIQQLSHHFQEMKETITVEQKKRQRMLSGLSHDLKAPLANIHVTAESLMEEKERNEGVESIVRQSNFMAQLIDDLHTTVLLKDEAIQPEKVTVDAEEFSDMLLSGYEIWCEEAGLNLETYLRIEGFINVDVKLMQRLMDNLVSNAIRHTAQGGRIQLAAVAGTEPEWLFEEAIGGTHAGELLLIVQNGGETINLNEVTELLSEESLGKSGLGLSIVKLIAELHGGRWEMVPCDQGTVMKVHLSLIEEERR